MNIRNFSVWLTAMGVSLGSAAVLAADSVAIPNLTLAGAERAAAAALTYARSYAAPGAAIAIVDGGGHTMLVVRLDGTFAAGADISVGKARTAVMFKRPTHGLEEVINKGRDAMIPVAAVTWFTPLQGGVPILVDGQVAGGIGVSGASSAQQDEEIAMAGAQALSTPVPAVTVERISANQVAAGFAEGETGTTLITRPDFRVNASRRDGPGQAEIHPAFPVIQRLRFGEYPLNQLFRRYLQVENGIGNKGDSIKILKPGQVHSPYQIPNH